EQIEVVVLLLTVAPDPHGDARRPDVPHPSRPRRELHVRAWAVSHRRPGIAQQTDLLVVQPHAVRDDGSGAQEPTVEELVDGPPTEPAERLLDLPNRLGGVRVDAGIELL